MWRSGTAGAIFVFLISPIKIHSANEPPLSPALIKTCSVLKLQTVCFYLAFQRKKVRLDDCSRERRRRFPLEKTKPDLKRVAFA